MNKHFDLGTVLSITTGVLLTEMENIYKILDYMTGDELYTHQLPRASRECEPVLLKQFPQLATVDTKGIGAENWREFLQKQVEKYGNDFEVAPLDSTAHKYIDPFVEMVSMIKDK